jgi:hypothetical protein
MSAPAYACRRPAIRRWPHIRPSLHAGDRLLDFGAAEGAFSVLAVEAGCEVVAVDNGRLPSRLPAGVTAVRRRVGADDLAALGQFDVVLALSVLHHLHDWAAAFDVLVGLTVRHLFVEVPHPDEEGVAGADNRRLYDHVAAAGGVRLCDTAGWDPRCPRTLWRIDR